MYIKFQVSSTSISLKKGWGGGGGVEGGGGMSKAGVLFDSKFHSNQWNVTQPRPFKLRMQVNLPNTVTWPDRPVQLDNSSSSANPAK